MAEHLFVGQIDTANPPIGSAGNLYRFSQQYGASVGTDVPLYIESQDVAPMGPSGVCVMRYIEVPIAYDAACTIAVTPIVDFGLPQETTTKQYPSPSARTQVIISAPFAKSGTTVRAAVQVTSRAGAVQVNTPRVVYQPKAVATTGPVGGTA